MVIISGVPIFRIFTVLRKVLISTTVSGEWEQFQGNQL